MNEWIDEQRDGLRDLSKKEEAYKTKAHTQRERKKERKKERKREPACHRRRQKKRKCPKPIKYLLK